MGCALSIKLALTAVLLGGQQLKVESSRPVADLCQRPSTSGISNPNAVVVLRNSAGKILHEEKIRVGQFDHYNNGQQRGAVPAKGVTFFYSYAATEKNLRAQTIELKLLDRNFAASASLQKDLRVGLK